MKVFQGIETAMNPKYMKNRQSSTRNSYEKHDCTLEKVFKEKNTYHNYRQ